MNSTMPRGELETALPPDFAIDRSGYTTGDWLPAAEGRHVTLASPASI